MIPQHLGRQAVLSRRLLSFVLWLTSSIFIEFKDSYLSNAYVGSVEHIIISFSSRHYPTEAMLFSCILQVGKLRPKGAVAQPRSESRRDPSCALGLPSSPRRFPTYFDLGVE